MNMNDIHSYYRNNIPQLNEDYENLITTLNSEQKTLINGKVIEDERGDRINEGLGDAYPMSEQEKDERKMMYFIYHYYDIYGSPKNGGNKKNKPKIYKNKIIQGKERNIYIKYLDREKII
jgi:hypothetical protein